MVISIMFVLLGLVAMMSLPVAQFPEIVPPEIQIITTYTGADAETVEQSVATPIEQQISGVDNMNYMYSVNASRTARCACSSTSTSRPTRTRTSSLPRCGRTSRSRSFPRTCATTASTVQKARSSPLMILALYSPNGTYDSTFLANYANINLIDQLLRVPG